MSNSLRHVFIVSGPTATSAIEVSLIEAGIKERNDLQEWVIANPQVLGNDVLIVTAEFDRWASDDGSIARERLDLLGLDSSGRLVVVELKRDGDPRIHLQAITYAALVSGFDEETLAGVYAEFLTKRGNPTTHDEALALLRDHVEGEIEADILAVPRIVLLAGHYPSQVVTSADWLTRQGLDVQLREVKAFKFGDSIAVTFDQLFPVPGVESLLLSPARRQAIEAVRKADRQARSASAVRLIVERDLLPDHTKLRLQPTTEVTPDIRRLIDDWVREAPERGRAEWINDMAKPILWEADGGRWKPTSLVRHILKEAADMDRSVRGTSWWITDDGLELPVVAGITGASVGRDWSDLHQLIACLKPGEWTSYGELGDVLDLPARPIGTHIGRCKDCPPGAWRILTAEGVPSESFHWPDAEDERSAMDVLVAEGLQFDENGRAHASSRIEASELRDRLSNSI